MRAYAIALCAAVLLIAFDILSTPALFLCADGETMVLAPQIRGEVPLTIHFIHSVQKTPVEEFLTAHADGHFHLSGTRYQSHGVGLSAKGETISSSIWTATTRNSASERVSVRSSRSRRADG